MSLCRSLWTAGEISFFTSLPRLPRLRRLRSAPSRPFEPQCPLFVGVHCCRCLRGICPRSDSSESGYGTSGSIGGQRSRRSGKASRRGDQESEGACLHGLPGGPPKLVAGLSDGQTMPHVVGKVQVSQPSPSHRADSAAGMADVQGMPQEERSAPAHAPPIDGTR